MVGLNKNIVNFSLLVRFNGIVMAGVRLLDFHGIQKTKNALYSFLFIRMRNTLRGTHR
jgi:hypothetical protein